MPPLDTKADMLARHLARAPVIPVVTIEDPAWAVPLARTLVEAGLPIVEITLRTDEALDAIERVARDVPDAVPAAGTVMRRHQIEDAVAAGARLLVTPGTPPALAEALAEAALPALPGCATASEAMALLRLGFSCLKFFPAAASGGTGWLRAIAGPLPRATFCPTGGIDLASAPAYLVLPNVPCIGGSWMVPRDALVAGDWPRIGALARAAAALGRGA